MKFIWTQVIVCNWWRYLLAIAACFLYAFVPSCTGQTWYRAEAILAFRNRSEIETLDMSRISRSPLVVFLDENPIEEQYELGILLSSINFANRVIGDRLDEVYDPEEYEGLEDFYYEFISQLSYDYEGDQNIVSLSYTYKDPVLATDFCNGFAYSLEQFLNEVVEGTHTSPMLQSRLDTAREDKRVAEDEVNRIAELYGIPDLLYAPREWVDAYSEALERSYRSEVEMRATLAALSQVRENRQRRNLLAQPAPAPDTTIIQDLILSSLRFRLAMINAVRKVAAETVTPESSAWEQFESESAHLTSYLEEQYRIGLDVEATELLFMLQEYIVEDYLHSARAEAMYSRLEQLPRMEAEVRPYILKANVASATVAALEKVIAFMQIGEEYGIHPIRMIDAAIIPDKPYQPAWTVLSYLLPTMLFISTLWFSLIAILRREALSQGISEKEPYAISKD